MNVRSIALGVIAAAALTSAAAAQITTFTVPLSGLQEVNASGMTGVGDADGSGLATLIIDSSTPTPTISWNIVVADIALPVIGAHIHQGNAGTNGPVRIDFNAQLTGTGLADADLLGVLANPSGWYVNVHNNPFPGGAVRGQIPTPGAAAALLALAPIALRRRRR